MSGSDFLLKNRDFEGVHSVQIAITFVTHFSQVLHFVSEAVNRFAVLVFYMKRKTGLKWVNLENIFSVKFSTLNGTKYSIMDQVKLVNDIL